MPEPKYVSRAIVDGIGPDGTIFGHYGDTVPVASIGDIDRYKRFLHIMSKLETRWVRTGDPQLRAAIDELHEWHREGFDR